jgi:hypothetical protein
MTRSKGWAERLFGEFVPACRVKPFAWGEFDCCLFACDVINLLVGVDPAAEIRGTYHDLRGALTVIAGYGGFERLVDTVTQRHGFQEIAVGLAQRGDLVLVKDEAIETCMGAGHPTLGIIASDGRALIPNEVGLLAVPRKSAVKAWRIG